MAGDSLTDTHPATADELAGALRRLTPAERLSRVFELSAFVRDAAWAGEQARERPFDRGRNGFGRKDRNGPIRSDPLVDSRLAR